MYSRNDELRKVDSKHLRRVYSALDSLDSWQVLMGRIPKNLVSKTFTPRYNKDHVKIIAEASKHRSPTEVLFDEWGTSGRIRPTVETLLDLLIEINMFRAADIVAKDLLGERPPRRPKGFQEITIPVRRVNDLEDFVNSNYPGTESLNDNISGNLILDKNVKKEVNIKSSSNINNDNDLSQNNIPDLSALNAEHEISSENEIISDNIPILSELDVICNDEGYNFPDLSVLQDSSKEVILNLPEISALQNSIFNGTQIGGNIISENLNQFNLPELSALGNKHSSENLPEISELQNQVTPENLKSINLPEISALKSVPECFLPELSGLRSNNTSISTPKVIEKEVSSIQNISENFRNQTLSENEEQLNLPDISELQEALNIPLINENLNVPNLSILNKRFLLRGKHVAEGTLIQLDIDSKLNVEGESRISISDTEYTPKKLKINLMDSEERPDYVNFQGEERPASDLIRFSDDLTNIKFFVKGQNYPTGKKKTEPEEFKECEVPNLSELQ